MDFVKAEYSLKDDGGIKVVNSGTLSDGEISSVTGKAKCPDRKEPGKLKVSFFLWFYSDYYILELDKDYKYVLVGSSSDNYLWILSRTPQLEKNVLESLLQKANNKGYDISKLRYTFFDRYIHNMYFFGRLP